MNIEPVFSSDQNKLFAWELSDVDIPEQIEDLINTHEFVDYNSIKSGGLDQPSSRYKLNVDNKTIYDIFSDLSKQLFNFLVNQNDYIIDSVWPKPFIESIKARQQTLFGTEVIRDDPGFEMGKHLDNNVIFATFLINLRDNNNAYSEYWDYKDENKLLYEGPSKRGTGVLHINSPCLLHQGSNKSTEYRYIAFGNNVQYLF